MLGVALVLKNTQDRYGILSVLLHWVSLVLVVALFAVGLYMVGLTYYDPLYHELPEWHKLVGWILALMTAFRILWVFVSRPPEILATATWQVVAAKAAHGLLYLLLLILPVTGYLISTAEGSSLTAFEWVLLPGIMELSPELADWAGNLHLWAAWGLIGLGTLHGLAALKHHFLDHDSTLTRMLYIKGR